MTETFSRRLTERRLKRRDFLWLATAGASTMLLPGCTVDPVTGEKTLTLMSEGQEIDIDRQQSPHQFSRDYGSVQDSALNAYLESVGSDMAASSHRPQMPYSFRAVNANYINAYAFPGGSIATTRGILLELEDEAELSALLGHEIGHVNARHAAERQTRGLLAQLAVVGATAAVGSSEYSDATGIVGTLGAVGASALLAGYSRSNEREADSLGMEYAARSGRNPHGMVGLMEVLVAESKSKPSAIETMFSTHPMSSERLASARQTADGKYANLASVNRGRERYMDNTANLRQLRETVELQQQAEEHLSKKEIDAAEQDLSRSLDLTPDDYAGLVMMSKVQLAQERPDEAKVWADKAREVYPEEAQGHHLSGISRLAVKDYDGALNAFQRYDRLLSGNPGTAFLMGVSMEGMGQQEQAAQQYSRYLRQVNRGEYAQHAYNRLVTWGYVNPETQN